MQYCLSENSKSVVSLPASNNLTLFECSPARVTHCVKEYGINIFYYTLYLNKN